MTRPVRGVVFDRRRPVRGVVFDKDGTLLDFHATWDAPFGAMLVDFAAGDVELLAELDRALGFDRVTGTIRPGSPFVAESNVGFGNVLAAVIGRPPDDRSLLVEIEAAISRHSPSRPVAEPGANELLAALHRRGVPMAVATNDNAARAAAQMDVLGWSSYFTAVYGYDSGHGEKPDPGMVWAAVGALGLEPADVAMVGDSTTDMGAGRAAGATTVLYGPRTDLRATADIVLGPLGDLLDYVAS